MYIGYLLTDVIWMCSIGILYATYVSKYTRVSPTGRFDMSLCMNVLNTFEACGLRLTDTTCEPLDLNWCQSNPVMVDGYTYLKKSGTTIMEFPAETNFTNFDRPFPINFTIGSVVEIRFAWHTGCTRFRINLENDLGHFLLHIILNVYNHRFYSSSQILGDILDDSYGFTRSGSYVTTADVQYILKIIRGVRGFLIYMDDVQQWEHPYDPKYEPYNFVLLDSRFGVVQGDIYQLTFRSG